MIMIKKYLYEFFNLLENKLTREDAVRIFAKYGIDDVLSLDSLSFKKAYKKLVLKYHPDKGGDNKVMQEINAAYDILKSIISKPKNTTVKNQNIFDYIYNALKYKNVTSEEDKKYIIKVINEIINSDDINRYIDGSDIEQLKIIVRQLEGYGLSQDINISYDLKDIEDEIQYESNFLKSLVILFNILKDLPYEVKMRIKSI